MCQLFSMNWMFSVRQSGILMYSGICGLAPHKELPCGVPDHIYHFPEEYGGQKCGYVISEEHLMEVPELSGIFEEDDDYLDPAFRALCEEYIPNTDEIKSAEAANAYLYLKSHFA